ncbi:MAG: TonB-dependent receptor, partial [Rhodothermales bacterium]|nr:TonB-dependent receptor [Rhodothermales bacterium]
ALEAGDNSGNYVKAIPRDVITGALSFNFHPFSAGITVQSSQRIFLDDANSIRLPGYTTTAVHMAYDFGRFGLAIDVFNLLDARFSSTGFPDPGGSNQVFLYPYADRQARVVVDVRIP